MSAGWTRTLIIRLGRRSPEPDIPPLVDGVAPTVRFRNTPPNEWMSSSSHATMGWMTTQTHQTLPAAHREAETAVTRAWQARVNARDELAAAAVAAKTAGATNQMIADELGVDPSVVSRRWKITFRDIQPPPVVDPRQVEAALTRLGAAYAAVPAAEAADVAAVRAARGLQPPVTWRRICELQGRDPRDVDNLIHAYRPTAAKATGRRMSSAEQAQVVAAQLGRYRQRWPAELVDAALMRVNNPTLSLPDLAALSRVALPTLQHRLERICGWTDKSRAAAPRQPRAEQVRAARAKLKRYVGRMPPMVEATARLRVEYPGLSQAELAAVAGVALSTMQARLDRLRRWRSR